MIKRQVYYIKRFIYKTQQSIIMAITNIHPHVGVQINAAKRKAVVAEEPKVPILFAPFVSNKGPVGISYKTNGGVLKCYNNGEFISYYGDLEFKEQGQQVLNIGNWLENGGGVLPCRLWKAPAADLKIQTLELVPGKLFAYNGNVSNVESRPTEKDSIYYCSYYQGHVIREKMTECRETETAKEGVTYYSLVGSEEAGSDYKIVDDLYYKPVSGLEAGANVAGKYVYTPGKYTIVVRAKYAGSFYYGIKVKVEKTGKGLFNVIVKNKEGRELERFTRRTEGNYKSVVVSSDYIGVIYLGEDFLEKLNADYNRAEDGSYEVTLAYAANKSAIQNDTEDEFNKFDVEFDDSLVVDCLDQLEDKLQIKCDYILDAGYKKETKQGIIKKLYSKGNLGNGLYRDDIIFLMDSYVLDYKNNLIPLLVDPVADLNSATYELNRVVYFDQYLTTEDIYSRTGNSEVYVTPVYFLAGLVPYNEIQHGAFFPNAGKNRGVISGAKFLNHNPTLKEKDDHTYNHINYIEKDSNSMQFMTKYTLETDNTALKYWNNVRCVIKMANEVESIGRWYIHEDTTDSTLRNLSNAIEKYMNDWVLSRALNKSIVEVYADENDDTLVHVILNIRFNGTIEIISVEINLD